MSGTSIREMDVAIVVEFFVAAIAAVIAFGIYIMVRHS